jgi:hypothetical protein
MSTSLMDVLSNGLAAVIILLIIGLSSSKQQEEGFAGATLFLIRVHGSVDLDTITLHYGKNDIHCRLSTERIFHDPVLRRRGNFPAPFDSTVHARLLWPVKYIEIEDGISSVHDCQEFSVSVTSEASRKIGEFRMDMPLNVSMGKDTLYYVEYKVINSFANVPRNSRRIGPFAGRKVLSILYSSSPEVK